MSAPRTHAEALRVAEPVTCDEVVELLALDDNPDVFRPNCPRRIAMVARMAAGPAVLSYEYCDRAGRFQIDAHHVSRLSDRSPVLHFHKLGRTVRPVHPMGDLR